MAKKHSSWGGRREGAGGPRLMDDPVRFSVQIESDVRTALEGLAETKGETLAAYCRRVLTEHVRRRSL